MTQCEKERDVVGWWDQMRQGSAFLRQISLFRLLETSTEQCKCTDEVEMAVWTVGEDQNHQRPLKPSAISRKVQKNGLNMITHCRESEKLISRVKKLFYEKKPSWGLGVHITQGLGCPISGIISGARTGDLSLSLIPPLFPFHILLLISLVLFFLSSYAFAQIPL